jgi:hypothetical protein
MDLRRTGAPAAGGCAARGRLRSWWVSPVRACTGRRWPSRLASGWLDRTGPLRIPLHPDPFPTGRRVHESTGLSRHAWKATRLALGAETGRAELQGPRGQGPGRSARARPHRHVTAPRTVRSPQPKLLAGSPVSHRHPPRQGCVSLKGTGGRRGGSERHAPTNPRAKHLHVGGVSGTFMRSKTDLGARLETVTSGLSIRVITGPENLRASVRLRGRRNPNSNRTRGASHCLTLRSPLFFSFLVMYRALTKVRLARTGIRLDDWLRLTRPPDDKVR